MKNTKSLEYFSRTQVWKCPVRFRTWAQTSFHTWASQVFCSSSITLVIVSRMRVLAKTNTNSISGSLLFNIVIAHQVPKESDYKLVLEVACLLLWMNFGWAELSKILLTFLYSQKDSQLTVRESGTRQCVLHLWHPVSCFPHSSIKISQDTIGRFTEKLAGCTSKLK